MRYLAVVLVASLLCLSILLLRVSPVNASGPTHGCAPAIPPTVAGSPAPAPATPGIIHINEVLTNPATAWNCSETTGGFSSTTDSWVELYNPQSQPYNLYTAHALIDSGSGTNPYYFPLGASIAAQSFLVVFPGTYQSFSTTETPTLRLVIGGSVIDQVVVPQLGSDLSYARFPDGGSKWQTTHTPTIDASNMTGLITPTPTSNTSGATRTPGSTGGSNYGSGSGSGGSTADGSSQAKVVSGTQPKWGAIQVPGAASTTANPSSSPSTLSNGNTNNAAQISAPTPTANTGADTPRRIIVTLLLIALAATLFWCWRLFTSP